MNKATQNDNQILEAPKSKDEYVNGLKIAIDILETYPEDKREVILNSIALKAPELIQKYHEEHFSFNDIKDLDNKSLQIIVTKVNHNDLVLALCEAQDDIRDIFFSNMSDRKQEMVKDDLKNLKNKTPNQIFEAQKNILNLIDTLRKSGLARFSQNSNGINV